MNEWLSELHLAWMAEAQSPNFDTTKLNARQSAQTIEQRDVDPMRSGTVVTPLRIQQWTRAKKKSIDVNMMQYFLGRCRRRCTVAIHRHGRPSEPTPLNPGGRGSRQLSIR